MLIAPISSIQNLYSKNVDSKNQPVRFAIKPLEADTVSFGAGIKPEILRNQMKMFLVQTIGYGNKVDARMPQSDLEREVVLEMLEHRKNLTKYYEYKAERDNIYNQICNLRLMKRENPNNPEIKALEEALNKDGNPEKRVEALDGRILFEEKLRASSVKYFEDIEAKQDEYIENHTIRYGQLKKFFEQVKKKSLNPDGKFTVQDLMDIISGKKPLEVNQSEVVKPVKTILSRDELLAQIERQYEQYLRQHVNIYMGTEHGTEAAKARNIILKNNEASIKRNKGVESQFKAIFHKVEKMFIFKTDRLGDADIYPIGEIWKDMDSGIVEMKGFIKAIDALKEQIKKNPDDIKLQKALIRAEKKLSTTKKDWTGALEYSIKYEKINRERFAKAGTLDVYDYLTAENKMINRYKELDKIRAENNGVLPQNVWDELLAA